MPIRSSEIASRTCLWGHIKHVVLPSAEKKVVWVIIRSFTVQVSNLDTILKSRFTVFGERDHLVLGDSIADRRTTFRIHIRELDWDTFHYFLPIGEGYAVLRELVGFILREPLEYDISLSMPARSSQPMMLSNNNKCRLGWTSWFGLEAADGTITVAGNINDNH